MKQNTESTQYLENSLSDLSEVSKECQKAIREHISLFEELSHETAYLMANKIQEIILDIPLMSDYYQGLLFLGRDLPESYDPDWKEKAGEVNVAVAAKVESGKLARQERPKTPIKKVSFKPITSEEIAAFQEGQR